MSPAGRLLAIAARHAADLPSRARHGRPLRITARAVIAIAVAVLTARTVPGTPAAPAITAGATLWWTLTLPPDLAPASQQHHGQEEP